MSLGKKIFNDQKLYVNDEVNPLFHRVYEFNAELPGESQLIIDCMDYDFIGSDDLIGRTVIDLEDRWFDRRWQVSSVRHKFYQ